MRMYSQCMPSAYHAPRQTSLFNIQILKSTWQEREREKKKICKEITTTWRITFTHHLPHQSFSHGLRSHTKSRSTRLCVTLEESGRRQALAHSAWKYSRRSIVWRDQAQGKWPSDVTIISDCSSPRWIHSHRTKGCDTSTPSHPANAPEKYV